MIPQRFASNAASILMQIRDGHARDFESLCKLFGMEDYRKYSGSRYIEEHVQDLVDAGLLKASDPENLCRSQLTATSLVKEVQKALSLSLSDLASRSPFAIQVVPFFGRPKNTKPCDVFVVMPFRPELEPVYTDHIRSVCDDLQLKVARGDDVFSVNPVVQDIWAAMCTSSVVIADCTQRNPNVFYELGMAHTLGKQTILITQSNDDVPFDLRHVRYIRYELTPRGMNSFEKSLCSTLREILAIDNATTK